MHSRCAKPQRLRLLRKIWWYVCLCVPPPLFVPATPHLLQKRQRTVKYVALTVVLLLFVILGFRRALKPASPGFAYVFCGVSVCHAALNNQYRRRQQGQGPDLATMQIERPKGSATEQIEPASRSHDKSRHHEHLDGDALPKTISPNPPDNKSNDKQPAGT